MQGRGQCQTRSRRAGPPTREEEEEEEEGEEEGEKMQANPAYLPIEMSHKIPEEEYTDTPTIYI